jgi:hypothetical protein
MDYRQTGLYGLWPASLLGEILKDVHPEIPEQDILALTRASQTH